MKMYVIAFGEMTSTETSINDSFPSQKISIQNTSATSFFKNLKFLYVCRFEFIQLAFLFIIVFTSCVILDMALEEVLENYLQLPQSKVLILALQAGQLFTV